MRPKAELAKICFRPDRAVAPAIYVDPHMALIKKEHLPAGRCLIMRISVAPVQVFAVGGEDSL